MPAWPFPSDGIDRASYVDGARHQLSALKTERISAACRDPRHEDHIGGIPHHLKNFQHSGDLWPTRLWPCRCCKGRWRDKRRVTSHIHPRREPPRHRLQQVRAASHFQVEFTQTTPLPFAGQLQPGEFTTSSGVIVFTRLTSKFDHTARGDGGNTFRHPAELAIYGVQGTLLCLCRVITPHASFRARHQQTCISAFGKAIWPICFCSAPDPRLVAQIGHVSTKSFNQLVAIYRPRCFIVEAGEQASGLFGEFASGLA